MDETKRQHLNHELRRRELYLTEARRLSLTGNFALSPSTGEIFASEEAFQIFELDRTTKLTMDLVLQRVHPEDTAFVKQSIERVEFCPEKADIEYRLLMPDGSVKYIHALRHPLYDKSGDLKFVGAVIDITAAKQAQDGK